MTTKTKWIKGDKLEIINAKGIGGHVSYGFTDGDICTVYDLMSMSGIHVRVDGNGSTGLIVGSEYECVRKIEFALAPDYKALYEATLAELNELKYPDLRLTFDEKVEFAKNMLVKVQEYVQGLDRAENIQATIGGEANGKSPYTIALISSYSTGEVRVGKAKRAHTDEFSKEIGSAVAGYRALGWDIPQELLNGTKPNASDHI